MKHDWELIGGAALVSAAEEEETMRVGTTGGSGWGGTSSLATPGAAAGGGGAKKGNKADWEEFYDASAKGLFFDIYFRYLMAMLCNAMVPFNLSCHFFSGF